MSASSPGLALVTGAAGFIGRHVSRVLAQRGYEVHGAGHGGWPAEEWRAWGLARWVGTHLGIGALDAWGGVPELVVHCAGGSSIFLSLEHPEEDFERSVVTTSALLDYVRRRAPGARVVLTSSAAVYGSTGPLPADETRPPSPESIYGVDKLLAEELCAASGRHYGISTVIVRLFSVYGAGLRKQLLWDACNNLSRVGRPFGGTGTEMRDWLHVDDAATLLALAAGSASPSAPAINGGTGLGTEVREVIGLIASSLGTGAPVFSGAARPGNPSSLIADIGRARRLGWAPRISWREGVRAYCDWFARGAT